MPDIGYQSPSGDDFEHLIVMRGNVITMPQAGQAGVTLTFRLFDDANMPGDSVKCGIFSADGSTLLAESAVRTDISIEALYTFSGGTLGAFTPANGATYLICVIANDASVFVTYDNATPPAGLWVQDSDLSVFGPPMAFAQLPPSFNDGRSAIGWMTYSAAGGSAILMGQAIF